MNEFQVSQQTAKCIPALVCPELTEQIRREVAAALHRRKGEFPCYFFTDLVTFTLPAGDHSQFIKKELTSCPGILTSCLKVLEYLIPTVLIYFTHTKYSLKDALVLLNTQEKYQCKQDTEQSHLYFLNQNKTEHLNIAINQGQQPLLNIYIHSSLI